MSTIQNAIAAVRKAASVAGDASGNMDNAVYLVEHCQSTTDTELVLGWAAANARLAVSRIDEALVAVKEARAALSQGEPE